MLAALGKALQFVLLCVLRPHCSTMALPVASAVHPATALRSCGVEYDVSPFLKRVDKGVDPDTAWQEVQPEIERRAKRGTWVRDAHLTGPDESGRWCHLYEIR